MMTETMIISGSNNTSNEKNNKNHDNVVAYHGSGAK